MATGQVVVTIVGNASQLSQALGAAAGDLDGFAAKADAVGVKMQTIGKQLTLGMTLPIVGIGVASFKAASDFESAFAGVEKTVAASEFQLALMRQAIINMSKEIPATTAEIAAVAEAAGALGVKTDDILKFTRVMIDLGETTDLTADQAATALAQLANIIQLSGDEFDELGSTIVDLGNNGASTESQIVEMAQRIAGAGKQVGLTAAQILAVGSALANVGIEAEAGGTAISRTFIEMAMAAEQGGDAIAGFADVAGQSADDFATKFKVDAAGAMLDFITGLQRIDAEGGSVLLTLDELGIVEIRQRDAILRLVGAGSNLADSLNTANTAWTENTALSVEAEKRYDTTAARMEILRNKLMDAARTIGEMLIPVVERVAGWFETLAAKFQALDPGMQSLIVTFAAIAAAVGPVLIVFGSLVRAVASISTGFTSLISFAMNPWVLTAGLVAGAAYGLVTAFSTANDKISVTIEKMREMNQEALVATIQKLQEAEGTFGDNVAVMTAFEQVLAKDVEQAARFIEAMGAAGLSTEAAERKLRKAIETEIALQHETQAATDKVNGLRNELGGITSPPAIDIFANTGPAHAALDALVADLVAASAHPYRIGIEVVGT